MAAKPSALENENSAKRVPRSGQFDRDWDNDMGPADPKGMHVCRKAKAPGDIERLPSGEPSLYIR